MKNVGTMIIPMLGKEKVKKKAELVSESGGILSQLWTPEPTLSTNIGQ